MTHYDFIKNWVKSIVNKEPATKRQCGNVFVGDHYERSDTIYSYGTHFPMAIDCGNFVLINGDSYSSSTGRHQSDVRTCIQGAKLKSIILPFSVLNLARVRMYKDIKIVEVKEDETREIEYIDKDGEKRYRWEHLLGGSVFSYYGRYFLSGNDPSANWGRGYFLTELKRKVNSIDQAFKQLKPDVVKEAEKKSITVHRQGEWFFIPVAGDLNLLKKKYHVKKSLTGNIVKQTLLPVHVEGRNPHHRVSRMLVLGAGIVPNITGDKAKWIVSGVVKHTSRDHRQLKLGSSWFSAVHNEQVNSWGVSGRWARVD